MQGFKKALGLILVLALLGSLTLCASAADAEVNIVLSDEGITVDSAAASTSEDAAVYVSHDIIYYEDRDTYDSGNPYGEGTQAERHSAEEAAAHTVVNITQPGTYRLSGTLSQGQIFVDLGSESKNDPEAVVTLLLDNVDITCTVAPAVFFYRVYECDEDWTAYDDDESGTAVYNASETQDTSKAGANVILADGSVNNVSGSHVARIYKDDGNQKKLHKYDGAFYSRRSMNITGETEGTGVLNIVSDNEGLNSELHLTINGGKINIQSQDDGINTNEDGVSVTTINGGALHIVAGLGTEGDGIDSNGYLVINGGVVIAIGKPQSDSGLDSDMGSYINGGYVIATGSTMDWAESDSNQVTMNLQFASAQESDEAIVITDTEGTVVFAYDPDKDETTGSFRRGYQGAVVSCPELQVGETYYVYIGGDVQGTETDGLYDASTVTGFEGAVRQQYTGTDVGMGRPGGMGRPEGMDRPEGMEPGMDHGGQRPFGDGEEHEGGRPGGDGFPPADGTMFPDMPDGERPEDWDGRFDNGGQRPDGFPGGFPAGDMDSGEASVRFYMTDKVNAFSGVADETAQAPGSGSENESPSAPLPFSDVAGTSWYYNAVQYVYSSGMMGGVEASLFGPEQNLARAMLVQILYNLEGTPDTTENPFTDVEAGAWYADAVSWAAANGIAAGYGSGLFGPQDNVTREQMAVILYNYAALKGYSTDAEGDLSHFADGGEVSSWAETEMRWAVGCEILSGDGGGLLAPADTATRAQAAQIFMNFGTKLAE